jgi:hypothetical protein
LRKESSNGEVEQWLAGGQRAAVLTSAKGERGKNLQPSPPFLGKRKRAVPVPHVGDHMPASSWTSGNTECRCPLLCDADGWGRDQYRATLFQAQPVNTGFYFFKLTESCKLNKPPLSCSKNSQNLSANRIEDMEQCSFWNKVQIGNRSLIKNP